MNTKELKIEAAVNKFLSKVPSDSAMFGQRFAIIGFTGSGKTTYSKALSKVTRSPHVELDRVYWKDGWSRPSDKEFLEQIQAAVKGMNGAGWIIDGNHAECRQYVWSQCDTIIWLDYPKKVILGRFLKRFVINWLFRKKLWGTNNRESIWRGIFSNKGIFKRLAEDYTDNRDEIFGNLKKYTFRQSKKTKEAVKVIRFTKPERAEEWLNYLELVHILSENRVK